MFCAGRLSAVCAVYPEKTAAAVSLHGGRCHGLSGGVCVGVSGYIFCLEPVDAISVLSGSADALFGVHFPAAESLKQ